MLFHPKVINNNLHEMQSYSYDVMYFVFITIAMIYSSLKNFVWVQPGAAKI